MDFGTLLHTAQKNEVTKKEPIRYYSTKFEPPKKEQRKKDQLSANIQRFLQKKEEEEKKRQKEAQKRKEELLALRSKDKKAVKRVNVMLKRTKSANQSVIQDAVDADNTAVTLAGPSQPDEDDYGYVSQEASAFYNKMMEKYNKLPDENLFDKTKSGKKVSKDLNSTKDRVRAAIEKEKEEALLPHKRKRKSKNLDNESEIVDDHKDYVDEELNEKKVKPEKIKPKFKAPPPLNFADLLKLAEKKQHEPIVIEKKPKEEESPLTKKQKKEMERYKEWQERKQKASENIQVNKSETSSLPKQDGSDKLRERLINGPTNGKSKNEIIKSIQKNTVCSKEGSSSMAKFKKKMDVDVREKTHLIKKNVGLRPPEKLNGNSENSMNSNGKIKNNNESLKPSANNSIQKPVKSFNQKPIVSHKEEFRKKENKIIKNSTGIPHPTKMGENRQVENKNKIPPQRSAASTIKKNEIKQFPPLDVRRPMKSVKMQIKKGRILDDDDEYDSEMDDFIDDGPEENNDYSKYISEIFGYNKSKYIDDDDDIDNMESTFAQQMKEEVISTKIGIMEDLEDMKMEEEHKKKKMMLKKKGKY